MKEYKVLDVRIEGCERAYAIVLYKDDAPFSFCAYSNFEGNSIQLFEKESLEHGLCDYYEEMLFKIVDNGEILVNEIYDLQEAINKVKMLNLIDPVD